MARLKPPSEVDDNDSLDGGLAGQIRDGAIETYYVCSPRYQRDMLVSFGLFAMARLKLIGSFRLAAGTQRSNLGGFASARLNAVILFQAALDEYRRLAGGFAAARFEVSEHRKAGRRRIADRN
jgi:hypothetical protein